jgi:lipoprotein-anchoring transpeptidase ErfK/SrfK
LAARQIPVEKLTFTVFLPFSSATGIDEERGSMGTSRMDARIAARMATGLSLAVLTLAGLRGEAFAQYYPPGGPAPYPPAPPPGYRSVPPGGDDDGPPGYIRPHQYDSQRSSGIQSEALPPPSGGPQGGGPYQDGAPAGRGGYTYGNWEPVRPGAGGPYGPGYGPGDRSLAPGPGADHASPRPPMEISPPPGGAPPPGGYGPPPVGGYPPPPGGPYPPTAAAAYPAPASGYPPPPGGPYPPAGVGAAPPPGGIAGLPPEDQPETGQPKELPPQFRRQMVDYPSNEPAGTIIIDTPNTYLYLVLGGNKAMRYGVGVGREGFTWTGREKISRMAEWPDWHPPKEMIERQPYLPRFMAGGESNPLGARAMYLGNSLYRIHGTNQPSTIGTFVSSGCIRLANPDVEDLFSRVTVGTKVIVLPGGNPGRRSAATTTPTTGAAVSH